MGDVIPLFHEGANEAARAEKVLWNDVVAARLETKRLLAENRSYRRALERKRRRWSVRGARTAIASDSSYYPA
jgi:hypothetical protein